LHEYLACGKPIVASSLDNLKEFEHVLHFAEGIDDWIEKIRQALDDSDPKLKMERIGVARQNSWDSRVAHIGSIIESKLS
jgi:hypothetical protein